MGGRWELSDWMVGRTRLVAHETARNGAADRHSQGTMRAAALLCLAPPFSRGLNASAFFVLP